MNDLLDHEKIVEKKYGAPAMKKLLFFQEKLEKVVRILKRFLELSCQSHPVGRSNYRNC